MAIYGGPDIITDGLVLCLDAANSKSYSGSGNTVYDLSIRNTNATLNGGATANSSIFTFDGVNDFISTSPGEVFYQYTTELTVCAWFKRNGTIAGGSGGGQSTQDVDNWSTNPATNVWLFHGNNNNTITFYVNGNNSGTYYSINRSTPVLNDNIWYFICGTCTSSLIKIYLNGLISGTAANGIINGIIVNNSNSVVQYGKDPRYSTNRFFNGYVGPNYLYNRALSESEILINYNATKGRFGL
jgi:hypothetical protein